MELKTIGQDVHVPDVMDFGLGGSIQLGIEKKFGRASQNRRAIEGTFHS